MTTRELTRFALGGLWRQKVRTVLTLVGVTVGTCALAFSLALGFGLHAFIEREFQGRDEFWRVSVYVGEPSMEVKDAPPEKVAVRGNVSEERRKRMEQVRAERFFRTSSEYRPKPPVPLTPEKLAAIGALPDVLEVRTYRVAYGSLSVEGRPKVAEVEVTAGAVADLAPRLLAGRLPSPGGGKEIVVSELTLYDLGMGDDADLERAVGMTVHLDLSGSRETQPVALARALTGRGPGDELTKVQLAALEKLAAQLPGKLGAFDLDPAERAELRRLLDAKTDPHDKRPRKSAAAVKDTYRVCGVVRVMTKEDRKKAGPLQAWQMTDAGAVLPPGPGDDLFQRLWAEDDEVYSADVRVRPGSNLQHTVDAIEGMGYRTFSGAKWFAAAKREVTLIAAGLNLFAMIALFVAGLGITNTLVTSVVERTKEIGILRSVGGTRAQVLGMFLAEGMFIGLLGSLLGLALARGLAIPADAWVRGILEKQVEEDRLLSTTVFAFPWWLWVGSVAFAVLVTTAAAYYPARRAARIHPIEALRYG